MQNGESNLEPVERRQFLRQTVLTSGAVMAEWGIVQQVFANEPITSTAANPKNVLSSQYSRT